MFTIFCKKERKETERRVKANDSAANARYDYAGNYIRTSKYNVFTFLPKNLFEQFQRLANFYFLILMILQLIPQISSLTSLTTILPLVAVLSITAAKDAIDDFQRRRSDKQVNNRISYVVRDGKLVEEIWQNVNVGDIIRMENDHFIAADLLLLSTSEPHGLCYIETAELDGETNLKAKQALPDTAAIGDDLAMMSQFDGEIVCEPPNNSLGSFQGQLIWNDKVYSLDSSKLLLRGCRLRNTKWCFGLVLFAGRDTKLMMNSGKTFFKRTSLDRFLNVLIIGIVVFLLSMCTICTVLCGVWEWTTGKEFQIFLPWESFTSTNTSTSANVAFIAFLMFFSYAILLNTVVPISLYVSVEVIRFCHSWWINWDRDMYNAKTDTPAKSRTTTLNEELGQIQYIFSDKTGTLTQNIMTFNQCSINGRQYGEMTSASMDETWVRKVKPVDFSKNKWYDPKFLFYDRSLYTDTVKMQTDTDRFWRLISLCHTVMSEMKNNKLEYLAQSPDEAALVVAARNFGYVFKSRTPDSITIEVMGIEEKYELKCILDFNNYRKRMSVLVKKDGKVTLYCKGADTVIFERISADSAAQLEAITQSHLDKFANDGLRTLCLAYKEMEENYFEDWNRRYEQANILLKDRQETLDKLYEEIETDMALIGATAIEDKLQDGVPECIANLIAANIKIWVLTGDKQETAINIGYSCRLLTVDMKEVFIVDGRTMEDVRHQLEAILLQLSDHQQSVSAPGGDADGSAAARVKFQEEDRHPHTSEKSYGSCTTTAETSDLQGYGLVISGQSLTFALEPQLEELLFSVGCACRAVICCRVTPLQKALVVDLVKRRREAVTLAIGDGANDVSMIKTAHIGIGVSGQEGMQAVLASDFSIAQFRYLEKLLLVHGRWSYLRMSKFLQYFFYKNFAFTVAHFWFAFFCGYSAQTIYDPLFIAFYNLFFTSLPVLGVGIFDQDVNEKYSLKFPRLYVPGQYNLFFNMRIFVYSVLRGILASAVLFFGTYAAFHDNYLSSGLVADDLQSFSFAMFSGLIVVVTAQIALDTAYWTVFNYVFIWGSLLFYFFVAVVYYQLIPFYMLEQRSYGVAFIMFQCPLYWCSILLVTTVLMMPIVGRRFFWLDTRSSLTDRIRIRQNLKRLTGRISEIPRSLRSSESRRTRKASTRSSYAFAHHHGFGDLITKGIAMKQHRKNAAAGAEPKATPSVQPQQQNVTVIDVKM